MDIKEFENDAAGQCYRRCIHLVWQDETERTCGEIKKLLMDEFGVKVVAEMLRRIDPELVKHL